MKRGAVAPRSAVAGVVAAVAAAGLLGGCVQKPAFHCQSADQCETDDSDGVCEPTGYCSFADQSCLASGRRYGDLAASPFAGTCVPCVATIRAGGQHTCARTQHGALSCWGDDSAGQLGDGQSGTDARAPSPVDLEDDATGAPLGAAIDLASGSRHTCAVLAGGAGGGVAGGGVVSCWGDDSAGQVGVDPAGPVVARPTTVLGAGGDPLAGVVGVAAGEAHTCAVTARGALWCWGDNSAGQLGAPPAELASSAIPVEVLDAGVVAPITGPGASHTCALEDDGSLWCWGANGAGQVGDGSRGDVAAPVEVMPAGQVLSAAAAGQETCALLADRTVACWGAGDQGQLGDGGKDGRASPGPVRGLSDVLELAVGGGHVCAREQDGSVWCWGANDKGQLGPDAADPTLRPARIVDHVIDVTAGAKHTCILLDAGQARCLGAGAEGQLGGGDVHSSPRPVTVPLICR